MRRANRKENYRSALSQSGGDDDAVEFPLSGRSSIPLLQPLPCINLPKALAASEVYRDYHAVNRMGLEKNLLNFLEARNLTAHGERSDDLAIELLFVA